MGALEGECDDRFGRVAEALAAVLDAGDGGASAAVFVDGVPVADVWGGYADPARTVRWRSGTIANVYSTTKTMVALCALILADRGELDLDAPVARYWPEFAASGKQGVLVRHLLGHTAGLADLDESITVADLYDWPKVTGSLAAQAPQWTPGTDGGYHSISFGFLVGVAEANTTAFRRAQVPAISGFGNARSVGAVQSVLACGGTAGGVRLLSPAGCERVLREQFNGVDRLLGMPVRYGLGYRLEGSTCSWGGWGGSLVLVDFDHRMTVSFVMNQVLWDDAYNRALSIVMAAYESVTG